MLLVLPLSGVFKVLCCPQYWGKRTDTHVRKTFITHSFTSNFSTGIYISRFDMDWGSSISVEQLPNINLGGDESDPDGTYSASLIGIAVAISGNVLISLALNCQKLAHLRLSRERRAYASRSLNGHGYGRKLSGRHSLAKLAGQSFESVREESFAENAENDNSDREEEGYARVPVPITSEEDQINDIPFPGFDASTRTQRQSFRNAEAEPLLNSVTSTPHGSVRSGLPSYGMPAASSGDIHHTEIRRGRSSSSPHILSRIFSIGMKGKSRVDDVDLEASSIPVDVRNRGEDNTCPTPRSIHKIKFSEPKQKEDNESDYLKSKLWCVV